MRRRHAVVPSGTNTVPAHHFGCPACGVRTARSVWSLAHADVGQEFTCKCGARLTIPPDPGAKPPSVIPARRQGLDRAGKGR